MGAVGSVLVAVGESCRFRLCSSKSKFFALDVTRLQND